MEQSGCLGAFSAWARSVRSAATQAATSCWNSCRQLAPGHPRVPQRHTYERVPPDPPQHGTPSRDRSPSPGAPQPARLASRSRLTAPDDAMPARLASPSQRTPCGPTPALIRCLDPQTGELVLDKAGAEAALQLTPDDWLALHQSTALGGARCGIQHVLWPNDTDLTPDVQRGLSALPQLKSLTLSLRATHELRLDDLQPQGGTLALELVCDKYADVPKAILVRQGVRVNLRPMPCSDRDYAPRQAAVFCMNQDNQVESTQRLTGLVNFVGRAENLNMKAPFLKLDHLRPARDSMHIDCRSLSIQWISDKSADPDIPFTYEHYESAKSISKHIPHSTEAQCHSLLSKPATILLTHGLFGQALKEEACHMQRNERRYFLLNIPRHIIAVELRRDSCPATGEDRYSVALYDPNLTMGHKEVDLHSAAHLASVSLDTFYDQAALHDYRVDDSTLLSLVPAAKPSGPESRYSVHDHIGHADCDSRLSPEQLADRAEKLAKYGRTQQLIDLLQTVNASGNSPGKHAVLRRIGDCLHIACYTGHLSLVGEVLNYLLRSVEPRNLVLEQLDEALDKAFLHAHAVDPELAGAFVRLVADQPARFLTDDEKLAIHGHELLVATTQYRWVSTGNRGYTPGNGEQAAQSESVYHLVVSVVNSTMDNAAKSRLFRGRDGKSTSASESALNHQRPHACGAMLCAVLDSSPTADIARRRLAHLSIGDNDLQGSMAVMLRSLRDLPAVGQPWLPRIASRLQALGLQDLIVNPDMAADLNEVAKFASPVASRRGRLDDRAPVRGGPAMSAGQSVTIKGLSQHAQAFVGAGLHIAPHQRRDNDIHTPVLCMARQQLPALQAYAHASLASSSGYYYQIPPGLLEILPDSKAMTGRDGSHPMPSTLSSDG